MAVLKPRRTERVAPRTGADRPIQRLQRITQEEVPIHTMQRPEMRSRPLDTRPRDISRPPLQERPVSKGRLSPRMLGIGAISILLCAALLYVLMKSGSTTVVEQTPAAEQAPVTESELKQTTTPEQAAQAEVIIKGLAKHILLPEQAPQVMQIMNPDELIQKDPFFTGSQSGDVLLIYKTVGKAIIYSPGRDIIVNVGPVQVEAPRVEPTQ